jgi:hypothetical protein
VTTAISSAIQAAVISHASPMPVRTAHAARIVGTRMKTLNRSARTAPTRRLAIIAVLIGCPHAHRAPKTLTELISSIAHWSPGALRSTGGLLPLGTCSRDQPVPNPGVGALNAVAVLQESITISNMQRRRRMQDGGQLFVGKSDGCVGSAVEGAMPKMICPHQTI